MIVRDEDGSIAAARGEAPPFDGAVLHIMPDGEVIWSDVAAGRCPKCGWEEDHPECPADAPEAQDDEPEPGDPESLCPDCRCHRQFDKPGYCLCGRGYEGLDR